jgi:hypothetical protein
MFTTRSRRDEYCAAALHLTEACRYYAEFQRNAGRFLYRADRTKQWAQELRMRNKKLFIVTNSLAG